ncbi:hypothetical protein [Paenibacillus sp. NEAU-GSW1]|uniref:hypothetical protein n=1 Tax=Paenibacillus sp. NEAU-GSW1 TaxID=2682486 RepID=UPI001566F3BA|nr:hypothetical protein [Paenibacillus sp. NEAU-GSW1]
MAAEYAHLAIWLIGLFGIVFTVSAYVAKFVMEDSLSYDQPFVWRRKLPEECLKND